MSAAMRLLVAIDGSGHASTALDLVAGITWPDGTEILVAEAVESGGGLFGGPMPAIAMLQSDDLEGEVRALAQETVDRARDRLESPGLTVRAAVLRGRPATVIVERARSMGADLIVMGSRGHGTIESMVLGSVSAEVVDRAPMPVLVARRPTAARIVLGWDGSTCAADAADVLTAWPGLRGAQVRVVSVADVEVPWWAGWPSDATPSTMPLFLDAADASRAEHDRLAREMAGRLREAGVPAEARRRDGDAATELLAEAHEWAADLVVVGTHGRTGLQRVLLGSVARNVLLHATCSVLVVRAKPEAV
jgi:nucleotide-binding universal stress UspA family protein